MTNQEQAAKKLAEQGMEVLTSICVLTGAGELNTTYAPKFDYPIKAIEMACEALAVSEGDRGLYKYIYNADYRERVTEWMFETALEKVGR